MIDDTSLYYALPLKRGKSKILKIDNPYLSGIYMYGVLHETNSLIDVISEPLQCCMKHWASSTGGLVRNYYAQFWIRRAAVSKRGNKVRTVAFPAVRSINKSRDTCNCVQNKPKYAICVIFTTRSCYKALGLILCYLL